MTNERRRYPRIEKNIPLKVSSQGYDIVTQTKNISCNGAYCSLSKFIPLMTKLKITLLLSEKNLAAEKKSKKVHCIGIVVRIEESSKKGIFDAAIYFEQIREKERLKLEEYLTHHIGSTAG